MNHHHTLTHQLIAGILLISLCLQSCGGISNQPLPQAYTSKQKTLRLTETNHRAFLVDQEFAAEKGYLVTFCEQDGNLQANVKIDASQKEPNYTHVPVVIAKYVNLSSLPYLSKHLQQRCIQVGRSSTGRPSQIVVARGGLKGGMMEGTQTSNQRIPKLVDIKELRKYFYKGILEITLKSNKPLTEFSEKYAASFMNYEGTVFVKDWEISEELGSLTDLLQNFSKIKKFKINCTREDSREVAEVIIRAIQFYEELIELDLSGCQLDDAMMEDIMESICSKNLQLVNVADNRLSSELIAQLQEAFPAVTFIAQASENTPGTSRSFRSISRQGSRVSNSPNLTSNTSPSNSAKSDNSPVYVPSEEHTVHHRNRFLPPISEKEIAYGRKLGYGGFGDVFEASYHGKTVAVKKLRNPSEEQVAAFKEEAMNMANHRHKNIVAFLGYCLPHNALVMEYVPGRSLSDLLTSKEGIPWQVRYQIALDVAEGMSYLHDMGVVHRDLKSENILVNTSGSLWQAKVADFGTVVLRKKDAVFEEGLAGTYRWMAPEMHLAEKASEAGDVYSYGMILWQLGARREPFPTFNSSQIAKHVVSGKREVISEDTPQIIKEIIEQCWLPEQPPFVRRRPEMRKIRYLLEADLEKQEKELARQLELENIIAKLPQGNEILDQLKCTKEGETLDLTNNYRVLNTDQRRIVFQHPCFKQLKLRLSIDASGAQELALALPNTQIHTLDLRSNKIGDEGASKIAQALPNTQIHTLYLSYNQIGDEGASKIAQALPNTQIHTLDLSDNNIGDEGASKIAQALPNTQIHTLYLSDNNIGDETQSLLKNQFPHIKFGFYGFYLY